MCLPGWHIYNGYCYYPSDTGKTHSNSRDACQAMGADLVSISDQQEMNFVLSISYTTARFICVYSIVTRARKATK